MPKNISFDNYLNRLIKLKHTEEIPVFENKDQITKLWNLDVDVDELEKLFSYSNPNGYERKLADAVIKYLDQKKVSLDEILKIAEFKDSNGNRIFDYVGHLFMLGNIDATLDDVLEVANVRDYEGQTIYRIDKDKRACFKGFVSIVELLTNGGKGKDVQELTDILDDENVSVFKTARDINNFIKNKGTKEYALDFLEIRDEEGKQIFDEFTISEAKERCLEKDYVLELMSLVDTSGKRIFSDVKDILSYSIDYSKEGDVLERKIRDINVAKDFVSLTDSTGETVFKYGGDIVDFINSKGTLEEAKRYIAIENCYGKTFFKGDEIVFLKSKGISSNYAEQFAEKGLNARTIMYYHKLGLSVDDVEFQENGKPKMLVLYPTDDIIVLGNEPFSDINTMDFLDVLCHYYDFKIRAISTVNEMREELSCNSDISLLILGGHGSQTTLTFGASKPKYGVFLKEEETMLSVDTPRLYECFSCLNEDGIIFLDSCLNGMGKETEDNLANSIAIYAEKRKVISSTDVFNSSLILVNNYFPLDIEIISPNTYKPCTYVVLDI